VILAFFTYQSYNRPAFVTRILPSGQVIRVQSVTKSYFSNGDPALWLKYETDLKISQKDDLRKEVEDIWTIFQYDVEKAGLKRAIITANKPLEETFFTKRGSCYNFLIEKQKDGQWKFNKSK